MADFITKKENGRRLAIIIVSVLADAVALTVLIYALKEANFVAQGEKNPKSIKALQPEAQKLRDELRVLEQNYYSYARHIGWFDEAAGTVDRFGTGPLEAASMENFLSYWADELKKLGVTNIRRWDAPGAEEGLTLRMLFEKLLEKETEYKTKITDLQTQINAEREKEKAEIAAIEKENLDIKETIEGKVKSNEPAQGLIGDLIKFLKDLNKLQSDHSTELATLEKESQETQNKSTETKNEIVRKRATAEAVKADYKRRIYSIQHHREEARERREPDGVILSVDEKRQLVYIDLLRKDRLFKGTRFTTYSLEKGGQKLDKAVIEVIEVREEGSSIASIVSTKDPEWPITAGDKIYNELYEGGRPRYIAFAGRFSGKLSNEEAASFIREFGDFYQEKVDEKTNYVVVADGYPEHPNFKAAQEYGIKILRESILYDYLGVRRD